MKRYACENYRHLTSVNVCTYIVFTRTSLEIIVSFLFSFFSFFVVDEWITRKTWRKLATFLWKKIVPAKIKSILSLSVFSFCPGFFALFFSRRRAFCSFLSETRETFARQRSRRGLTDKSYINFQDAPRTLKNMQTALFTRQSVREQSVFRLLSLSRSSGVGSGG